MPNIRSIFCKHGKDVNLLVSHSGHGIAQRQIFVDDIWCGLHQVISNQPVCQAFGAEAFL